VYSQRAISSTLIVFHQRDPSDNVIFYLRGKDLKCAALSAVDIVR
jgi:hypothetical protein